MRSCLRLCAAHGFDATSIDAIAAAVGLTKGAVYWHFSSKTALFDALLEHIRVEWKQAVLDPMRAATNASAQLTALFDGYAALLTASPEVCIFLQRVLLGTDRALSTRVAEVYAQTAAVIADIFRRGIASGEFRADVAPDALAYLVLGTLTGTHAQTIAQPQLAMAPLLRQALDNCMRSVRA